MQGLSVITQGHPYTDDVAAGRPAKHERYQFGAHLTGARQRRGLSQAQVAERLEITQQTYAGWERRTTALRPEYFTRLAGILDVDVDYLLGYEPRPSHAVGPVGRARRVFEAVSRLPRSQQQRILGVVEDLLAAQRVNGRRKESAS
jgi:transcriptional regulator with XRE-family HTH domain